MDQHNEIGSIAFRGALIIYIINYCVSKLNVTLSLKSLWPGMKRKLQGIKIVVSTVNSVSTDYYIHFSKGSGDRITA